MEPDPKLPLSADRQVAPNGGEATPLTAPPEPPPGAEMDVPADHGELADDAPRRRRRRWALLRVLLATLLLGWWTQRAMRRHFEAGPYTGPLYRFESPGVGLMDDTGRILISGSWNNIELDNRYIDSNRNMWDLPHDPGAQLLMATRRVSPWVVGGYSWLRREHDVYVRSVIDVEGRELFRGPLPWIMTESRYLEFQGDDFYVTRSSTLVIQISDLDEGRWRSKRVMTRTGKSLLEVTNQNWEVFDQGRASFQVLTDGDEHQGAWDTTAHRVLYVQEDRLVEVFSHPASSINEGDPQDDGQYFVVEVDAPILHLGGFGLDLRWQLPAWNDQCTRFCMIANAPGSRLGDPPVLTGDQPVDGAWLSIPRCANRLVMRDGLWGLQAPDGRWLAEPKWRYIELWDERTMRVTTAAGLVGCVDLDGSERMPAMYTHLWPLGVEIDGQPIYEAATGGHFAGLERESADDDWEEVFEDDAGARIANWRYGLLRQDGTWLLPPTFARIDVLEPPDGPSRWIVGAQESDGPVGLFHADGSPCLPMAYAWIDQLAADRFIVKTLPPTDPTDAPPSEADVYPERGWWRWTAQSQLLHLTGDHAADQQAKPITLDCQWFSPYADVGYLILRDGKLGLLDLDGREILPPNYVWENDFPVDRYLVVREPIDGFAEPFDPTADATAQSDARRWLLAYPEPEFGEETAAAGGQPPYRVFDTTTRTWLPLGLGGIRQDTDLPYAWRTPAEGWGLLLPDMQTILDGRALGLSAPLLKIEELDDRWRPIGRGQSDQLYRATTHELYPMLYGVFDADGKVLVPFICTDIKKVDRRFLQLEIDESTVLMDRAGRLFVPGGETTWAALGAPGFVPGRQPPVAAAAVEEDEGAGFGE